MPFADHNRPLHAVYYVDIKAAKELRPMSAKKRRYLEDKKK